MSEQSQTVVRLHNVGKMYKLYASRLDNFLDALGLDRLMPWRKIQATEFWALRNIDLELKQGQRIGIIGRNGAGKSTLLKLVSGNISPTEGEIDVRGSVQALLTSGAGFHPEFTGYENIRAALVYQGLTPEEIEDAVQEIAEFTELGQFLEQPFKTYSAGMQARLTFATATVIKPEILIVDEILGAGDAYFFSKSIERMTKLVESGASVLLVSHALDQIIRFCDEAIWIERGRIVQRGPALEVVKAYEQFVRVLEERRLKAKNRKRLVGGYNTLSLDLYSDVLTLSISLNGRRGGYSDIAEVRLLKDGKIEDVLGVGQPQDSGAYQPSAVVLSGSDWSAPRQDEEGTLYRRLSIERDGKTVVGKMVFYSYLLFEDAKYSFIVRYRGSVEDGSLTLSVAKNERTVIENIDLPLEHSWMEWQCDLPLLVSQNTAAALDGAVLQGERKTGKRTDERWMSRWPGEGSLLITDAILTGHDQREKTVFAPGDELKLLFKATAQKAGLFDIIPVAVIYRLDGIRVSAHIGEKIVRKLERGTRLQFELLFPDLMLGDGNFVFSIALYRELDSSGKAEVYDLIDRSLEFKVEGHDPYFGIFQHPSEWRYF